MTDWKLVKIVSTPFNIYMAFHLRQGDFKKNIDFS